MAALWEVVGANAGDVGDLPEADRLMELCEGYDSLVAETDELAQGFPELVTVDDDVQPVLPPLPCAALWD